MLNLLFGDDCKLSHGIYLSSEILVSYLLNFLKTIKNANFFYLKKFYLNFILTPVRLLTVFLKCVIYGALFSVEIDTVWIINLFIQ